MPGNGLVVPAHGSAKLFCSVAVDRDLRAERRLVRLVVHRDRVRQIEEDAVAAANGSSAVAENVPGEAEAWTEVAPRDIEAALRNTSVAREHDADGSIDIARGPLTRPPCGELAVHLPIREERLEANAEIEIETRDAPSRSPARTG